MANASRGSLEMSCWDLPGSSCRDRRYPVKDFFARLKTGRRGEGWRGQEGSEEEGEG